MTNDEHIKRHKKLHNWLDEIAADYFTQTERLLSETTVLELLEWSYGQTIQPGTREQLSDMSHHPGC